MENEIIATGKTVEEAIDSACEQLGVAREQVEWEILELPKKSLFRSTPAKVKVVHKASKVKYAKDFLHEVLGQMGLSATEIAVEEKADGVTFTLEGEGLGVIIGRRGETLDALQYLTGLVANKIDGDYFRVTIDSGNYRLKREKTLQELAVRMANTAVKTGRSTTLEPMNPYERRIIHAAVQTVEGATSNSFGEEPNRRVVISSKNPVKTFPPRGGSRPYNNNRRDGAKPYGDRKPYNSGDKPANERKPYNSDRKPYNNDRKPYDGERKPYNNDRKPYNNDRRPYNNKPAAGPAPSQQPKAVPAKDAEDKPLYSKIDLD
ncbi:RNA-binding cell elongation regulator Jag/EloR [Acetanaerobacterium elongatum]|uniref:RNA-binding protein KhpB n=1 Tax=Acetanaerobacterium elongatum TaxID=258515 RepID=A0A1H0DEH0_9FIRM|nr:RNA-binding cell elongation regulator Jag/EloR [Acetanaerobacterium elongatum]SDN68416.1 spoIIIJ-associated protein [Acetanaerobacterium elongatum]